MERSKNWENERFIFEKLKLTRIFKLWKRAQFDCQLGKCAWCGKPVGYRYTETDHVMPLYYGGNSEATNMVLCHRKCNKDKSTSTRYNRPDWIKKNSYDEAVTGKYHSLVAEYLPAEANKSETNTGLYSATGQRQDDDSHSLVADYSLTETNKSEADAGSYSATEHKQENNRRITLLILAPIIIFAIAYIILLYSNGGLFSLLKQKSSSTDEDNTRMEYTRQILSEYSKYYDYWVVQKGYSLPADAEDCYKWNGCGLSFPLGNADVPEGYRYSINSLAEGNIFTQSGEKPHATKDNIALYKKARCGENGTVIGGSIDKNAAVVVQLSDNSYYCVQN